RRVRDLKAAPPGLPGTDEAARRGLLLGGRPRPRKAIRARGRALLPACGAAHVGFGSWSCKNSEPNRPYFCCPGLEPKPKRIPFQLLLGFELAGEVMPS